MKKDYLVVSVSPEMMIPELPEPACGANFRGGLGILNGDEMGGLAKLGIRAIGFMPLYRFHWMTREDTIQTIMANTVLKEKVEIFGKTVEARVINRGGTDVLGLWSSDVFNVLYVADRWQRLQQEVLIGHALPIFLKKMNIKPDIIWLQEGHTAITSTVIKEDPYFAGVKFLFTTHTPVPEGMEKFPGDWFGELKLDGGKYHSIFVKDGIIDMTRAQMIMADKINAVSDEHCEVTKRLFPEFVHKIVGITNGSSRELWLSPNLKTINGRMTKNKFREAQKDDKEDFVRFIGEKTGIKFNPAKPILGWVRRIAWYKQQHPMLAPIINAICAERGEFVDSPFGRLEGLGFQVFSAGRAHESDTGCMGWMAEFEKWMKDELRGRFVFLPQYNFELLRRAVWGCDDWLSSPLPEWEACGTSDQRASINGKRNHVTKAGGAKEYIKEYNPVSGEGNGFFIEPYNPKTLYRKLKISSDLYYAWTENGDERWLKLGMNAFRDGKNLDMILMTKKYKKIFEVLLN